MSRLRRPRGLVGWAFSQRAVFLLVPVFAVLAMTVGLIRSETAADLRVLSATGASGRTRRMLTGATAGALALLGALLGTAAAYLGIIAWNRGACPAASRSEGAFTGIGAPT